MRKGPACCVPRVGAASALHRVGACTTHREYRHPPPRGAASLSPQRDAASRRATRPALSVHCLVAVDGRLYYSRRSAQGANINRSLLALANCINALNKKTGKGAHVPYRDSKLTRMLKARPPPHLLRSSTQPAFVPQRRTERSAEHTDRRSAEHTDRSSAERADRRRAELGFGISACATVSQRVGPFRTDCRTRWADRHTP